MKAKSMISAKTFFGKHFKAFAKKLIIVRIFDGVTTDF